MLDATLNAYAAVSIIPVDLRVVSINPHLENRDMGTCSFIWSDLGHPPKDGRHSFLDLRRRTKKIRFTSKTAEKCQSRLSRVQEHPEVLVDKASQDAHIDNYRLILEIHFHPLYLRAETHTIIMRRDAKP